MFKKYLGQKQQNTAASRNSPGSQPSREVTLPAFEYAKIHNIIVVFDLDYCSYTENKEKITLYYSVVARKSAIVPGSREEFA